MREENQLKIICRIIENYQLDMPLSRHLRDFYKTHPQMGSRDRRLASAFVYNYYRFGNALNDLRMTERLALGNFLCSTESNSILKYCLEKFSLLKEEDILLSSKEKIGKIKSLHPQFNSAQLFLFADLLSEEINRDEFTSAFLRQPKLWIRVRRAFLQTVREEFTKLNIQFEADENNSLSLCLANATSLEKTDSFSKGYFEIQDLSSQQTIYFIQPKAGETWLDACAGSGGKGLMMADAVQDLTIFATDRRPSVLKNLEERFSKTEIKNFRTEEMDWTRQNSIPDIENSFNGILADVPCTGSGTWARTPEWLTMFNKEHLEEFISLQRNIVKNLSEFAKPGA